MKKGGLLLLWVLMFAPILRADMVFNPKGSFDLQYEDAVGVLYDVYQSNDDAALAVIDSLASKDYARAVFMMGTLYCNGIGVEQNNEKAVHNRYIGSVIQTGVTSSSTSRIVPPPIAVTKPTTYAPNQSNRFADANRIPEIANAKVPIKSNT